MSLKLPYDLVAVKYIGEEKRYISSLKVWVETKDVLICTQLDSRYLLRANSVTKKLWEPLTAREVAEALISEPTLVIGEEVATAQDEPSLLDEEQQQTKAKK